MGGQLWVRLIGGVVTIVFTAVVTLGILKLVDVSCYDVSIYT